MNRSIEQTGSVKMGRRNFLAAGMLGLCGCATSRACTSQSIDDHGKTFNAMMDDRSFGQSCRVAGSTGPITIYAVRTGMVSVKENFLEAVGPNRIAKLAILADCHFAPAIPIYSWVIAHPEGIFVVDTGENARVTDPRYFDGARPMDRFVNRTQLRFQVSAEDEIGPQLRRIGFPPNQVKQVILTHLHLDHTDGLKHFEGVEILVYNQERRHPYKDLPHTYPRWFKPTLFDYHQNRAEVFGRAFPVTAAEDLLIVPTPGHTPYHASVLLRTASVDFLFAGDLSYSQAQLIAGQVAAAHADFKLVRKTYKTVKEYASRRRTVFLPSHDPDSGRRLALGEVLLA